MVYDAQSCVIPAQQKHHNVQPTCISLIPFELFILKYPLHLISIVLAGLLSSALCFLKQISKGALTVTV